MRARATVALEVLLVALAVAGATIAPAVPQVARHPSGAVARAMARTVHQRLCYAQNAWLSGRDPHYGLIITQVACGGSYYNHWWLQRKSLATSALWTVVDERSGKIDRRAGCTTVKRVPADIRCK